ncbi:MAG: SDR family oxidoreductase [Burkholderiales bacterium]|jgi:NAD(P)-dependent dehydrogenase (short-subunit alcohol dehydrogenase family)
MSANALSGIAVITGGASGIGLACAREMAARGAQIVLLDRDHSVSKTASEFKGHGFVADVTDEQAMRQCAEQVESEVGPVEILVNSAGIIQQPLPPGQLSMHLWDEVIRVDQRGTYLTSVVFGEYMAKRGHGAIVNIASIVASRSVPLHAYAPAKAAVVSITECLAAEWGPAGIRVNAVSPGHTLTPALQDAIDKGERDVATLERNNALGRMVQPVEVARAAAFLAGPDAGAITGVNLPVDCGWLVTGSWHSYGGLRNASGS